MLRIVSHVVTETEQVLTVEIRTSYLLHGIAVATLIGNMLQESLKLPCSIHYSRWDRIPAETKPTEPTTESTEDPDQRTGVCQACGKTRPLTMMVAENGYYWCNDKHGYTTSLPEKTATEKAVEQLNAAIEEDKRDGNPCPTGIMNYGPSPMIAHLDTLLALRMLEGNTVNRLKNGAIPKMYAMSTAGDREAFRREWEEKVNSGDIDNVTVLSEPSIFPSPISDLHKAAVWHKGFFSSGRRNRSNPVVAELPEFKYDILQIVTPRAGLPKSGYFGTISQAVITTVEGKYAIEYVVCFESESPEGCPIIENEVIRETDLMMPNIGTETLDLRSSLDNYPDERLRNVARASNWYCLGCRGKLDTQCPTDTVDGGWQLPCHTSYACVEKITEGLIPSKGKLWSPSDVKPVTSSAKSTDNSANVSDEPPSSAETPNTTSE